MLRPEPPILLSLFSPSLLVKTQTSPGKTQMEVCDILIKLYQATAFGLADSYHLKGNTKLRR
jgi:hypothetical protein